jgi:hypothetical protein
MQIYTEYDKHKNLVTLKRAHLQGRFTIENPRGLIPAGSIPPALSPNLFPAWVMYGYICSFLKRLLLLRVVRCLSSGTDLFVYTTVQRAGV